MATPQQPLRCLICSPDFPLWDGGVAVMAEKLALSLNRLGIEPIVVTPLQTSGDLEFDHKQPYKVLRVSNIKDRYLKYYINGWKVRRLIRRQQFAFILCTTWHPFGSIASALPASTPFILLANGNDFLEPRWQKPFWKSRMLSTFRRANQVMPCSEAALREVTSVIPGVDSRCSVLYPGLDSDEYDATEISMDPPILVSVGRVVPRKGQDMVIRALPAIIKEFPKTKYIIGGRGGYIETLKQIAAEAGVTDHVEFAGFLSEDEKKQIYQKATIYLMPSRSIEKNGDFEGFGITYLEAGATGRPVIGGRSAGVAEAVVDGVTGFLVDPNSPEDIATKTLGLLRNPAKLASMGRAGRKRVEDDFRWESRARQLLNAAGVTLRGTE